MTEAEKIVREFWRVMGTNDFYSASAVLGDEFVLEWPQSGERIRGARNFAAVNSEYPAHGARIGVKSLLLTSQGTYDRGGKSR